MEIKLTSWYVIILLHFAGEWREVWARISQNMLSACKPRHTLAHTEPGKDTNKANTKPSANTSLPFTSI